MKIFLNITKIVLIFMMIIFIMQNNVFAGGWGQFLTEDTDMDIDIKIGTTAAISSSKEMTERIGGILQVVGSIISVLALVIIGIRYMTSSVEQKADMKGVLPYYIVGAILVFATSNILGVAYDIIFKL